MVRLSHIPLLLSLALAVALGAPERAVVMLGAATACVSFAVEFGIYVYERHGPHAHAAHPQQMHDWQYIGFDNEDESDLWRCVRCKGEVSTSRKCYSHEKL